MPSLGIGKIRGLSMLSDDRGIMKIVACDQRGAMKRLMKSTRAGDPSYEDMVRAKVDIIGQLSPYATGALLDPEYGAAPAVVYRSLSGQCGLVVSIEKTGYSEQQGDRFTELLDGWSVQKTKMMGVTAVKMLVYYNPTRKAASEYQNRLIETIAAECREYDIPFMLEGVVYPSDNEGDVATFMQERETLIIESAKILSQFDIDLYKVEFPVHPSLDLPRSSWRKSCEKLTEACRTPWALLSAGVNFDTFVAQLEVACLAGASGFVAGRAIWQEAVTIIDLNERRQFMEGVMVERIQKLNEIATQHGRPWFEVDSHSYRSNEIVEKNWYEKFYEEYPS